jgi:hypothetical protein
LGNAVTSLEVQSSGSKFNVESLPFQRSKRLGRSNREQHLAMAVALVMQPMA